jgi:copper homeostasis protein (lipoprotein)
MARVLRNFVSSNMKKFPLLGVVLLLAACQSAPPEQSTELAAPDGHTSQMALDWAGEYRGVLPCADCEGIKTSLRLYTDGTYQYGRLYMGKSQEAFYEQGQFSWDAAGRAITLEGDASQQFQVGEGFVRKLDINGQPIVGNLAKKYELRLIQADSLITNRYWKLVALNGLPVAMVTSWRREPHLIFNDQKNEAQGSGGCNSFFGSYQLERNMKLRFGMLAATKMYCVEVMATEQAFLEALEKTDSYHLNLRGDTLQLHRARMAPLAVLVEEYLR